MRFRASANFGFLMGGYLNVGGDECLKLSFQKRSCLEVACGRIMEQVMWLLVDVRCLFPNYGNLHRNSVSELQQT